MDFSDIDPQLCIVHLTDLHFGKALQGNFRNRVDDIRETIKSCINSGTVLLLVTGDIAQSGAEEE